MISYSFFKKSDFWLKCHMPKHLILEKLNERISPPSLAIRTNEFRGHVSESGFRMERRAVKVFRSSFSNSYNTPIVSGTFHTIDEQLYVHIKIRPTLGRFFFAFMLGLFLMMGSIFAVFFSTLGLERFAIAAVGCGAIPIIFYMVKKSWNWEIGYVVNVVGEITRGTAVDDPTN